MRSHTTLVLVLELLTAGVGCKARPVPPAPLPPVAAAVGPRHPLPAGSLQEPAFVTYALYFETAAKVDPLKAFDRLAAKGFFAVRTEDLAPPGPSVRGWSPAIEQTPPPDATMLSFFGRGLTSEQQERVAHSRAVFALQFEYPSALAATSLRHADALASALAQETGGTIYDAETRELFTLEAFRRLREASWDGEKPIVPAHVTVHAYQHAAAYRAVSLGMNKLGLPDLCVRFPGDRMDQVGALLRRALQASHDRPSVEKEGLFPLDSVQLEADFVEPEDGDAPNRLIELRAPPEVLDGFGDRHQISGARGDDEELQAASRRARSRLPELKKAFGAARARGVSLQVKAPFSEGAEHEFMWVEVQKWEGARLTGVLLDQPRYVSGLVAGTVVIVAEKDVFDWLQTSPDGGVEGNETTDILRSRAP